ncbi:hypothetical protein XAC3810_770068 [Xanthomonas citri pv. citri]|uniref:Uncharacterized protein n=1 Tax=Xanthomonas citri pv. citri TaxID=611301 RepID=A0A0U4YRQ7_XANCI|nr:hypothetical protein XAC902_1070069 [Xanthomonas citri pv. citri]CEJ48321.1 hypothetical protein XAB3213_4140049 [Xanthomonas citri pv. bilvae]CEE22780.1 hypothetical protein XAC908_1090030 [Xanthomonas citri pv. citri]CEE39881.1 hypothetical protein XAC3824_920070 [Xanthomonas citri pv. citri]CEE39950.1 hypothetical protein XAC9322_740071 [Xanthomonas citri pv. citri]
MTHCVPKVGCTNASYTPPVLLLPLDRT